MQKSRKLFAREDKYFRRIISLKISRMPGNSGITTIKLLSLMTGGKDFAASTTIRTSVFYQLIHTPFMTRGKRVPFSEKELRTAVLQLCTDRYCVIPIVTDTISENEATTPFTHTF